MKLILSDCHLDLILKAGTTSKTRPLFQARRAKTILDAVKRLGTDCDEIIDCGDIFHNTMVSGNEGLGYVLQYFNWVTITIAANHDIYQRVEKESTLQVLHRLGATYGSKVFINSFGERELYTYGSWGFITHVSTQEVFEELIQKACEDTSLNYLVIHANWKLGEQLLTPSTLNVNDELADKLAKRFTRVFMGHNHKPGEYNDGKIVSLGTPFPCNISEATHDCRVVRYDQETDELHSIITYKADEEYKELYPDKDIEGTPTFVRIRGDWSAGDTLTAANELFERGVLVVSIDQAEGREVLNLEEELTDTKKGLESFMFSSKVGNILSVPHFEVFQEYLVKSS